MHSGSSRSSSINRIVVVSSGSGNSITCSHGSNHMLVVVGM